MGTMGQLIENGRLAWRLINDPRVPSWVRFGIPALVALYFISPFDFIPDFLPVIGEVDDLAVILLGMNVMMRFAPSYVVDEHRRALGYDVSGSVSTSKPTNQPPGANNTYWQSPPPNTGTPTQRVSGQGSEYVEGEYKVVPPDSERQSGS